MAERIAEFLFDLKQLDSTEGSAFSPMQNLGTVGAIAAALLLLGNMLTTPLLMSFGWKIVGLLLAGLLTLVTFFYCGHRYGPTSGWMASGAVFTLCLLLLGMT